MPHTLGSNDYFVPEEVEPIWHIQPGTLRYFVGPGLRNNRIGGGGFGDTFSVDGWLGEGLPSFPTSDQAYGPVEQERLCCFKIIRKTDSTEPVESYDRRTRLEYQTLRDAAGANGRVPRPLALGHVNVGGDTRWGIAMEYLANGNGTYFLSDSRIANDRFKCIPGLVEPLQAATFAYQLCRALIDLHAQHITHRDLQPNNVAVRLSSARSVPGLSNRTGIVDRVFMIDLGNSTTIDSLVTPVMGGDHAPRAATFEYGAPEVFDLYENGNEGAFWRYRNKPTADYWSLGALIYYYVTGSHPGLLDNDKSAFRERAMLPKQPGLSLPKNKVKDPVLELLDDIVRRCTVFDPTKRAEAVNLVDFCQRLETILQQTAESKKTEPDLTINQKTPKLTRSVTLDHMTFEILDLYESQGSDERYQTYRRRDDEGREFRLTCSQEKGFDAPDKVSQFANIIAQRIDRLFLHGGIAEYDALRRLGNAGATVRPGKGSDRAYRTIEFTVAQGEGMSYVVRLHLYFVKGTAIMVSLSCLCPQERDYETKLLIEREMASIAASIRCD